MEAATENHSSNGVAPASRARPFKPEIQNRLLAYRDENRLSNGDLARELDTNQTAVSKYLNGKPEGDVARLEAVAEDVLKTAGARAELKLRLFETNVTTQISGYFEQVRKTDDFGLVHGAAGLGKSRAVEIYAAGNPTAIALELNRWQSSPHGIEELLFQTLETGQWPGNVRRIAWMVQRLRKSRRLLIFDNAQRLSRLGLEWIFDFHDATGCPVALVGNPEVLRPIRSNDQQFSRIGIVREVKLEKHADIATEMVAQILPELAANAQFVGLATQVVKQRGHMRALRKQLVLTRDFLSGPFAGQPALAFKTAHDSLVRDYKLKMIEEAK
jgi:hypothetical protein